MIRGKLAQFATMLGVLILTSPFTFAETPPGFEQGTIKLQSAGSLAFGPQGTLLIGDAQAATVYGVKVGNEWKEQKSALNIENITQRLAAELHADADKVTINDLAVNPRNGEAFFSVTEATAAGDQGKILKVSSNDDVSELSLKDVIFCKATMSNPPPDRVIGEGRRARNRRLESITDLAFMDGMVYVSGLAGENPLATVRGLAFPLEDSDGGTSIEFYHAAHGRYEDYAAPQTFAPFTIGGEPHILAGFTCTPLVKFPVKELQEARKLLGTTVAELGNRNRPLDMIVYEKEGQSFLLMANSARGTMKVSTENIEREQGLTERVSGGGTAGQEYESIDSLKGVTQMDQLDDQRIVVVIESESGTFDLKTVPLP